MRNNAPHGGEQMTGYATVRLLDLPFSADRPFLYSLPQSLQELCPGQFVYVPFGRGNRLRRAVIFDIMPQLPPEAAAPGAVKEIAGLITKSVWLDRGQLALCEYLAQHSFCSVGAVARAMVPSGVFSGVQIGYAAGENPAGARLSGEQRSVLERLWQSTQPQEKKTLAEQTGLDRKTVEKTLERLCARGLAVRCEVGKTTENIRYETRLSLAVQPCRALSLAADGEALKKVLGKGLRSGAYARALRRLARGPVGATELAASCGLNASQRELLQQKGLIRSERIPKNRLLFETGTPPDENILSEEQLGVFSGLAALLDGKPHGALLYGVTGSGKTRVIKALCDKVIAAGRQIILLVPEIALTPQSLRIFCSYYKDRVAVLHSALSEGERLDEWRRIRAGEVDLVIGTRSAVFAPVPKLGLLVIDEEQEHTYKSEQDPKFHARDAARFRCAHAGALMLLASATPSVESFYKAKTGVYSLFTLKNRYGTAQLPRVLFADLRLADREDAEALLSPVLLEELHKNEEQGEQSILFLNRRGYHNYVSCYSCGEPLCCPHCSVTLTAHVPAYIRRKEYDTHGVPRQTELVCHYCGYHIKKPSVCPHCASEHLRYFGTGTQRTEDLLSRFLPQARVLRMDADSTRKKGGHEEILSAFRRGEADILLGTQMVTKGHDFPRVSLSAVLNADGLLAQDDFRAQERAFSLITQVVGRAGRAGGQARAVIQTRQPEHKTLRLAAAQDYEAFYEGAIALRRARLFPPFCNIALFSFAARDEEKLREAAMWLCDALREKTAPQGPYCDVPLEVFGPFEAAIYRVSDEYRMRAVVKCRENKRMRALFTEMILSHAERWHESVGLALDFDPSNL